MTSPIGRHRKGAGTTGLLIIGAVIALSLGFIGGFATDRFLLADSSSGPSPTSPSSTAVARSSPASPAPSREATSTPAEADPAPPGPQGEAAYLAALEDAGVPVRQHRDAVLVLGRGLCQAPPEQQADVVAAGERIRAVVGDLLSPDQAKRLAELAVAELC